MEERIISLSTLNNDCHVKKIPLKKWSQMQPFFQWKGKVFKIILEWRQF